MKRLLIAAFLVARWRPSGRRRSSPPRHRRAGPAPAQAPGGVFRSRREVDHRRRHRPRQERRDRPRAHRRGLRGPRGRPAAAGPQLQLRGDQGQGAGEGRDRRAARRRRGEAAGADRSPPAAAAAPAPAPAEVPTSESMAGRRLITLLFDVSSMQPDDVQRAVDSAQKYVSEKMSKADMVSVVTVSSTLNVLTDFTADRGKVATALTTLGYAEGTADAAARRRHRGHRRSGRRGDRRRRERTSDLDMFNNDIRLRALKTVADTLAPIEQKKAIIYFSAGMQRSGAGQPGRAPRGDQRRGARPRRLLHHRHPRPAGGRARRRRAAGQRPRQRDVLRPRRRAAVRHPQRLAGHADLARRRHRRPRLHRHQRLRRGVRPRAERHVGLLPARLQHQQPDPRRPLSPHRSPREARRPTRSNRAAATTPTATSPTPAAAIARRSCRISCSRRSRRPTCRCW